MVGQAVRGPRGLGWYSLIGIMQEPLPLHRVHVFTFAGDWEVERTSSSTTFTFGRGGGGRYLQWFGSPHVAVARFPLSSFYSISEISSIVSLSNPSQPRHHPLLLLRLLLRLPRHPPEKVKGAIIRPGVRRASLSQSRARRDALRDDREAEEDP